MLGLTYMLQRFNICTLILQFFKIPVRANGGKVNTVYNLVPSDGFHELNPEDLCTIEWSKDTPQLQVDYHMYHRNYEIKVMKNQQVQKKRFQKRLKTKKSDKKQRKECKIKHDLLDKIQKSPSWI